MSIIVSPITEDVSIHVDPNTEKVYVEITETAIGIPKGGTTGQVLAKTSGTNYDTEWVNQSGGGGGSAAWGGISGTISDQTDLQDALNAKEGTILEGTTGQYYRGDKTFRPLDKSAVGLGNVDNTSDANKAVNTNQPTNITGLLYGNGSLISPATPAQIQSQGFPSVTRAQRDALAVPVGYIVWNNEDKWYDYYDEFWGWMPVSITNEWKRKYGVEHYAEFSNQNISLDFGGFGTSGANSATAPVSSLGTGNEPGIVTSNPGTTTTGSAGFYTTNGSMVQFSLGNGITVFESRLFINKLSDATDRFQIFSGLANTRNSVNQTRGAWFLYDNGGVTTGSAASANWQIATADGSVRTFATTSIAVAAQTWYVLKIVVNAAGTSVRYYINDTEVDVSPITTNIPTGNSKRVGLQSFLIKSAGVDNTQTISHDYISFKQKFTTIR